MTRIGAPSAAARSPIPEATEPAHIGATARDPVPKRMPVMWDVETTTPYFRWMAIAAFLFGLLATPLLRWLS